MPLSGFSKRSAGVLAAIIAISVAGGAAAILGARSGEADAHSLSVYVADTGANRIRSLDNDGNPGFQDPIRGAGEWTFDRPEAIAVGLDGTIYVADTDNSLIRVFDAQGTLVDSWGGIGIEPGNLRHPRGIAVAPNGDVIVADSSNHRVQIFTTNGDLQLVIGGEVGDGPGEFRQPQFVAVGGDGRIYVVDHMNNRIQVFAGDGAFIQSIGDALVLERPEGVAVDADGNLYVTDWGHRVAQFSSSGAFIAEWGRFGQRAGEFVYPSGIAVDRCGAIWVADWGNHRIQRFDGTGRHLQTWGANEWWSGEFLYPSAIALVENGGDCNLDAIAGGELQADAADDRDNPASGSNPADLGPDGHFDEVQVSSDGTRYLIPLAEIQSGGTGRDGIPAINRPEFTTAEGWKDLNYDDDGLVIGIEVEGIRRAYPFQILDWHEIVNDEFAGLPVAVTYCPLCGSGVAFRREIDGQAVEFGVSGQLYNSDLLMYDRHTDTLWSQLTGTAVVGELAGQRLDLIPVEIMTWRDWREAYPDSEVLNRDTGYGRPYDASVYGDYANQDRLMFPVRERSTLLPVKERVTGVELTRTTFGAYADRDVANHGPVNDDLGGVPLLIVANREAGNNVLVFERTLGDRTLTFDWDGLQLIDRETGSIWGFDGVATDGPLAGSSLVPVRTVKGFWFAWFAFHPETALWQPSNSDSP